LVFRVQDPVMLKQVKVGDKVKCDADRVNGQLTVIKVETWRRLDSVSLRILRIFLPCLCVSGITTSGSYFP
jgi:hypothetical protein